MPKFKLSLIFFLILLNFILSNCSQPLDCSKVKNGNFFYYTKLDRRKVAISRSDSLQIEVDTKNNDSLRSKIAWENDCKYKMFINAFSKNKLSKEDSLNATKPATIEIIAIESDFYICISKFSTSKREYAFRDTMYFQK